MSPILNSNENAMVSNNKRFEKILATLDIHEGKIYAETQKLKLVTKQTVGETPFLFGSGQAVSMITPLGATENNMLIK